MEGFITFPESWTLDIASPIDAGIKAISKQFAGFFDAVNAFIAFFLDLAQNVIFFIPWWVFVLIIVAGGYLATRRIRSAISYGVMITIIGMFGYWDLMVYTLAIVFVSVVFALILGLPYGILMAENKKVERFSLAILDAMQTMPSWVYLIPAVSFFGLGRVPAVFATLIYALPPVVRLTSHAVLHVDQETLEAAKAFGTTRMQALIQVKLPQAAPTILTGVNQTTMMAVAMVVTASMIGARGLGTEVLIAINRLEVGRGFEAGLSIVFIAIVMDRLTQGLAKSLPYNQTRKAQDAN